MSRLELAHGTILLPAPAASRFRRELFGLHRAENDRVFRIACELWRGLRRDFPDALSSELEATVYRLAERRGDVCGEALEPLLLRYTGLFSGPELQRPRRADLPQHRRRGDLLFLGAGDWTVAVEGRKVTLAVHENNHALAHAELDPVFDGALRLLAAVQYTRGSGGEILQTDEYSRGYGAPPSVYRRFGP